MTSRQASDEILDEAIHPTGPDQLPGWLGGALHGLVTGAESGAMSYALDPEPESVSQARHFTIAALRTWGLAALCEDAALVVSELVTNALRHSLPPHAAGRGPRIPAASIRLRLLPHLPYVLCGVIDSGGTVPRRREPDFVAETGRGLHLVESFSKRWGWTPLPCGGKIVWALFGMGEV